ncbi:hypothetical protein FRC03_001565 [Tulasnella sp. 419]|nr:hypothetical protein FRC03_001565 [Tulasnella sp. 419]
MPLTPPKGRQDSRFRAAADHDQPVNEYGNLSSTTKYSHGLRPPMAGAFDPAHLCVKAAHHRDDTRHVRLIVNLNQQCLVSRDVWLSESANSIFLECSRRIYGTRVDCRALVILPHFQVHSGSR